MSTTTLFVELLIIGFQTCFWLTLLISLVIGDPHLNWLSQFAKSLSGHSGLLSGYMQKIPTLAYFLLAFESKITAKRL